MLTIDEKFASIPSKGRNSVKFLAILQAGSYEWMCISETEAGAKQGVFDGYNTYLKHQFEFENPFAIEITSEFLSSRLEHYYKTVHGGDVSLDTLSSSCYLNIIEMKQDECYRDGHRVPRREQDI